MTSSKSFFAYTLRINKNSQDKVEVEIERKVEFQIHIISVSSLLFNL